MPETHVGVDGKLLRAAQWVLQFDRGASSKHRQGSGGVLLWNSTGQVVDAHALWFAGAKPTVNCAKMAALVWGFELLVGRGVKERTYIREFIVVFRLSCTESCT